MTTIPAAATVTDESVGAMTAKTGIRRLNPEDGLFLRSEHLDQMQTYSRELALAAGIASGTGVVYGFGLTLSGSVLSATPGLAIDAGGMPLRTDETITVPLDSLSKPSGRFWLVEVVADADQPSGEEPVYGNLCGDPCSGTTIHPWLDDGVRIQVSPRDTLPEIASVAPAKRLRNNLASRYFEWERYSSGPWLTPDQSHAISPLANLPWSEAQPSAAAQETLGKPASNGVPLGVLFQVDGKWAMDVWTARRDLVAPVPRSVWEAHLGLRPWAVFVAQVLQFQAQLADVPDVSALKAPLGGDAEQFMDALLKHVPRSRKGLVDAWAEWSQENIKFSIEGKLVDSGFTELPPAGFLPPPTAKGGLADQVQSIFGPNVVIRLHHNSADAALRAVTEAQHLDRIPLDQPAHKPVVDVWFPDTPADLPALTFDGTYPWIAFARSRADMVAVAQQIDLVDVFIATVAVDTTIESVVKQVKGGKFDMGDPVTGANPLQYPAAQWAVPNTNDAVQAVADQLAKNLNDEGVEPLAVIAVARSDPRRPLAYARAALLEIGFLGDGQVNLLPAAVVQRDAGPAVNEAIIFVLTRPPQAT